MLFYIWWFGCLCSVRCWMLLDVFWVVLDCFGLFWVVVVCIGCWMLLRVAAQDNDVGHVVWTATIQFSKSVNVNYFNAFVCLVVVACCD